MTDITSDCTFYESVIGSVKIINIVTPSSTESSDTIDLNSDVANGRGQKIKTILNTLVQDDEGADKDCTWDPDTGIITIGTITTGIHNIMVVGL